MKVNLKKLTGNWKKGLALDKHKVSSTFTGHNDYGRPTFDTIRTEAGEAVFRLKYRNDWSQSDILAKAIFESIVPNFEETIGLIVPVPPSTARAKQPVVEISKSLATLMGLTAFTELLGKTGTTSALKNIEDKATKVELLKGKFMINDSIKGDRKWNALLVDDLYDTGATLEAACTALKGYTKINNVYVATATWTQ